jgi:hypothetical protein
LSFYCCTKANSASRCQWWRDSTDGRLANGPLDCPENSVALLVLSVLLS